MGVESYASLAVIRSPWKLCYPIIRLPDYPITRRCMVAVRVVAGGGGGSYRDLLSVCAKMCFVLDPVSVPFWWWTPGECTGGKEPSVCEPEPSEFDPEAFGFPSLLGVDSLAPSSAAKVRKSQVLKFGAAICGCGYRPVYLFSTSTLLFACWFKSCVEGRIIWWILL